MLGDISLDNVRKVRVHEGLQESVILTFEAHSNERVDVVLTNETAKDLITQLAPVLYPTGSDH